LEKKVLKIIIVNVMKKYLLFVLLILVASSCYKESVVPIEGDFTTSFVNADESVPVVLQINNAIQGGDTYKWEFEGGSPSTSTLKKPEDVTYEKEGTYTINLLVENGFGESKKFSKTIIIKAGINIQFTAKTIDTDFSPVTVAIANTTIGDGLTYSWTFEAGAPATYLGNNPPNVVFTQSGNHSISLTVSNGFETQTKTQTITVAPALVALFTWKPDFVDQDYQAPVGISFLNQSISATKYSWTFAGGVPATSDLENPVVSFADPGVHEVKLVATNGKKTEESINSFTVFPDTNLSVITDVKLGINVAHNSNLVGAFFATSTRQVYKASEINAQNSPSIDIIFQGLNSSFSSNKFISPDKAGSFGFTPLAQAQTTIFINSQDLCNCGLSFSVSDFDTMINDTPLKSLLIPNSVSGAQGFGDVFPRVVLFQTQDGRKGAIKIKERVVDGAGSYIICDIKVQKQ
jgi:PKD repeat protein